MGIQSHQRSLTILIVAIVLAAGWFVYRPALSGAFLLDDQANLGGLSNVTESTSALRFILSGSAGPGGRPLALASFVPQAGSWEDGARPFLTVNILIHLVNACLSGAFLYLLTVARGTGKSNALLVSVTAMMLWLFMPLLATSTLMIVQRMTTLSAMFVLLGLCGYLLARRSVPHRKRIGLVTMSAVLAVAGIMAALSKESGALLPVFVLAIETTLLRRPRGLTVVGWRSWMSVFLLAPTAIILAYLAIRVPYSEALVLKRDFSAWERLLTESRILWEYLSNAFVPRSGQFGPFHDAYPIARSIFEPLTFLSMAGWVVVATLAVAWRRSHPLFSFAVLWFLGGHLLESTVIPLEVYFEHRNYIPIIGPLYALCHVVVAGSAQYITAIRVGMLLYILVNAFVAFNFTSLWGNPAMAARHWYQQYPASDRAATTMATHQLAADGPEATLKIIDDFVDRHPSHAYIGIPALTLSCIIAPGKDHAARVKSLAGLLKNARFSYTASTMLSQLQTTTTRVDCRGLDSNSLTILAQALAENPRYVSDSGYQQLHHQLMASIARQQRNTEEVLDHLYSAIEHRPNSRLNMMVVTTLVSADRFDDARKFIQMAEDNLPLHPLKRWLWRIDLVELENYVRMNRDSAGATTAEGIAR